MNNIKGIYKKYGMKGSDMGKAIQTKSTDQYSTKMDECMGEKGESPSGEDISECKTTAKNAYIKAGGSSQDIKKVENEAAGNNAMKVYKTCANGNTTNKTIMKQCKTKFKTALKNNGGNDKQAMSILNKSKNNFGSELKDCLESAGDDKDERKECQDSA